MSEQTTEGKLHKLQTARNDLERNKALVIAEVNARAEEGELWSHGQCKAWPDYESSVKQLDALRAEYGV